MTYVELHCHSAYSFLDGASQPEELAVRAAELGYEALALTDHDGVYGSLEFAIVAKEFGVRPITGAELTLATDPPSHVTVLVETSRGYANLCQLITAAHRVERREPRLDPALFEEHGEGLVCLSGCARQGVGVKHPNVASQLARVLGPEHFYVELQRPFAHGDTRRNMALRELARELSLATVATGERPCSPRAAYAPARRSRCDPRGAPRSTDARRPDEATTSSCFARLLRPPRAFPTTLRPFARRSSSASGSPST